MDYTPTKKVQFTLPPSIKEERKKLKPWCEGLCSSCEDGKWDNPNEIMLEIKTAPLHKE